MDDLFVDRLGNITVANGVARLDFLRLESLDDEKKQATLKPSTRLVIPMDGLAQMMQMLEQLRERMVKQAQIAPIKPTSQQSEPPSMVG